MAVGLTLTCPVRGPLKAPAKSADGLTPSEEARRIEAIDFLIKKGYPKQNFKVEATIKRFGHGGKNSFRADLAVLDVPVSSIDTTKVDELLEHAVLLGEIKRDHAKSAYVKETQVEPMLDFAHNDDCVALDLAGVVFSSSVELLSSRFGAMDPKSGSKVSGESRESGLASRKAAEAA